MALRLALFEPDIPQNTAAIIRTAACLGLEVDIIEPCGFIMDDTRMRRVGLDYLTLTTIITHPSWVEFQERYQESRRILLTTKSEIAYTSFDFHSSDILVLGRETSGVPKIIHEAVDYRIKIPMKDGLRSFNIAVASAMVTGEALRQLAAFPQILKRGLDENKK